MITFSFKKSNYNCGPASTNAFPASFVVYLAKFLMKRPARSFAFTSHSAASAYVLRGSRMFVSTPGSSVGTSKLKYGIFFVSALAIYPSRIASMIPRVSLIEIRFPVPFHPVFTKYAFEPLASIFLTNSSAYFVGCNSKNA